MFRLFHAFAGPLQLPDVTARLTTGVTVSWAETGKILLTHGLAYPFVLACLAAWIMRRREMALAG